MNTTIEHLSSLSPVQFTYLNSDEELNSEYKTIQGGLNYIKHDVFKNFQDIAFSNKTTLILTSSVDLKKAFKKVSKTINPETVSTSFKLNAKDTEILLGDTKVKVFNKKFYIGGQGDEALFNTIVIDQNKIHLRIKAKRVIVEENYPYSLFLSDEPSPNIEREIFELSYVNGLIALKNKTKEGYRFVSFGKDRQIRCVGLELNDSIINEYYFTPEFFTAINFEYDYDPTNFEVKYFTEADSINENKTVAIKQKQVINANLLIDCPLKNFTTSASSVPINLAIMRTNFSPLGTFNNSL